MTFVSFHCLGVKPFSFGSTYLFFFSPIFPFNREGTPFTHLSVFSLLFLMSILKRHFCDVCRIPSRLRRAETLTSQDGQHCPSPHFLIPFSWELSVITQFMLSSATLKDKDCRSVSRSHKIALIVIEN